MDTITLRQLATRWNITLRGVKRRRERMAGFPPAVARGPHGVALYSLEDVKAFEALYAATRNRTLIGGAA